MRRNSPAAVSAAQPVVHRLGGHRTDRRAHAGGDRVGVGVRAADDFVVHGEALAGDLETCVAQGLGVGVWRRRHPSSTQSHKLERVKKAWTAPVELNRVGCQTSSPPAHHRSKRGLLAEVTGSTRNPLGERT